MEFIEAALTTEVPPGGIRPVTIEGRKILIYHTASGFHASDDRCPHRGGPLAEGDLMGEEIVCPWHLWSFDVRTGRGHAGPDTCLTVHQVRVEGEKILVALNAEGRRL